ncbi:hypothetical protein BDN72DRAFT_859016 [Pluteus cervinus]|uniref:Uncharacterized protein n=1 Tax=Pluteus cervinus TaxID=181527 RepID=A0ACD3APQ9_9AGAR|nr:hypothetical protein BDN72DRAFT_859016 [Pluteus cervinus]
MSTTTQILFNSPALHSLKRDQLVKLCKVHSIKASGKNVELIERLKDHALTLPKDAPLSVAARSEEFAGEEENKENEGTTTRIPSVPRPSEHWEVMECIEEEDEKSSQGTLNSLRSFNGNKATSEFGTGPSKENSVGSSIRALATSLGLKRANNSNDSASSKRSLLSYFPQPPEDELILHAIPYDQLPPPPSPIQTDHLTFTPPPPPITPLPLEDAEPLPGHYLRPGLPAPDNARLSLGLGLTAPITPSRKDQPTTTIRLISNPTYPTTNTDKIVSAKGEGYFGTPKLQPFQTDFDLVMASPSSGDDAPGFGFGGFGSLSSWPPPASAIDEGGIYPKLPMEEIFPVVQMSATPASTSAMASEVMKVDNIPGAFSMDQPLSPLPPPPKVVEPFVFGSPQHNVTAIQFSQAAANVLAEMNARLLQEGVTPINTEILRKLRPAGSSTIISSLDADDEKRPVRGMPGFAKRGEIKEKFDKLHEEEFKKMQSIVDVVKRRPPKKATLELLGTSAAGRKRKSNVLAEDGPLEESRSKRVSTANANVKTRVISSSRRALPGAFGEDDDDDEQREDDDRGGKRVRVNSDEGSSPEADSGKSLEKEDEDIKLKEKEREAIKRRLEMNKSRRRSSLAAARTGRPSIGGTGGPRPSGTRVSMGKRNVLVKPKPKPGRFGFFSSAKSIVASVLNRGKSSSKPTTTTTVTPSPMPKASSSMDGDTKSGKASGKEIKEKPSSQPSGIPQPEKKASISGPARPPSQSSATASGSLRLPSGSQSSIATVKDHGTAKTASSRARSPLPSSFGFGSSSSRSMTTSATKDGSSVGVSSIGTRTSLLSGKPSSTGVGSFGFKKTSISGPLAATAKSTSSTRSSSMRTSNSGSRLLAPTASSLAKATRASAGKALRPMTTNAAVVPSSEQKNTVDAQAQDSKDDAENKKPKTSPFSPTRPGMIFSQPLQVPADSRIPSPTRPGAAVIIPAEKSRDRIKPAPGRKPRISRSKVIAKLASQRAASGSGGPFSSGSAVPSSLSSSVGLAPKAGRTRSSLGVKAHKRSSYAGGAAGGVEENVLMSAKKRARQSEYYARRRSKLASSPAVGGDTTTHEETDMDIDE